MDQEGISIVLLVDSDKDYREKISRSLEKFPSMKFQVLWASTIKEATIAIGNLRPSVIVSELELPDSKGAKTLATYYNKAKGIPLVILSDEEHSELQDDAVKNNVEVFLKKKTTQEYTVASFIYSLLVSENDDNESEFEGLRVLIIDDDAATRYIQGDYLRHEGCIVEEAEDGFMALAILRKGAITDNQFDVVIVDLMMPNMDGFEFLSTIRKRSWGKDIPLLVSSSRNDSEAIMKCKFSNIRGYIVKPATRDAVLSKVLDAVSNKNRKD